MRSAKYVPDVLISPVAWQVQIKILLTDALMPASGPAASASPQRSPGMAAVTTGLPWHAPVGHRQPRAGDLTDAVQPSPADED
jgi:hypothetical protein